MNSKQVKNEIGSLQEAFTQDKDSFWKRRGDLTGVKWKMGFLPVRPWLLMDQDTRQLSGFLYELWMLVQKELNVSIAFVESHSFGHLDGDGNWKGLVGMLKNKEVDISLTSLIVSFERQTLPVES